MSDDCFFNPAACEEPVAEEPEQRMDEVDDDDHDKEMWEPNDDEKMWMFEAQMAMLMLAGEIAVMSIMDITSWRWANLAAVTDADGNEEFEYYDFQNEWWLVEDGELGNPLYKWAAMMHTYVGAALGTTMLITQALSMIGIASGVNMMIWGYGGMIMSVVGLLWGAMTFFQHWFTWIMVSSEDMTDETYEQVESGDDDVVAGIALIEEIEWEWLKMSAQGSAMALTLWAYGEAWMVAQWWALPEEERMAAWEEMEDEKEEDDMGKKGKKMMLNRLF